MRRRTAHSRFSRLVALTAAAGVSAALLVPPAAQAEDAASPPKVVKAADTDDDGVLDAPDTGSASAGAIASGKPVEDLSARTQTSTVEVNPDGTKTLKQFQHAVRVKVDGEWEDVDPTLVEQADGTFRPKVSATDIVIGAGGSKDVGQVELADGHTVTVTWPQTLPTPSVDGNVATYRLSAAADLLMIATGDGVAARLRLNERPTDDDQVFTFGLRTDDLAVSETPSGGLAMKDDAGKTLGVTAPLVAWDAKTDEAGQPLEKVALDATLDQTAQSGDTVTHDLDLTAPDGFLTDPNTQFPVIIDPDVTRPVANSDTFVRMDDNVDHGGDFDLRVGKTTTTGNVNPAITYIKWNTPTSTIPAGSQIIDAEVSLLQWWSGSCSAVNMVVQPLASNWPPSILYPQRPSSISGDYQYVSDNKGYQCAGGPGRVSVPATAYVSNWIANRDSGGGYPNYGLRIGVPDANEGQSSYGRRFCSYQSTLDANCPNANYEPYLRVTYNEKPFTPTITDVTYGGNPASVYVTVSDPNPEPALKARLRVFRGTTLVWQGDTDPASASAGTGVPVVGRLPYLPDGDYTVTAAGFDGYGESSQSPAKSLKIDTELGSQSWYSTTTHGLNDRSGIAVNNRTGGLSVQAGDISVNGLGLDMNATRFYNSQVAQSSAQGTGTTAITTMGKGWGLSVGPDVWMRATTGNTSSTAGFTYFGPGGTNFGTFTPISKTNKYTKPRGGVGADLTKSTTTSSTGGTTTTWVLAFRKSQIRYEFGQNPLNGDLYQTKIRDRSGNEIKFAYTGFLSNHRFKLGTITDSSGRTYAVTYSGLNISSIAETSGTNPRTWSYAYDTNSNTMTSYTVSQANVPSATQVTNYTYQASPVSTAPLLTKIEDPAVAGGARTTTTFEYHGAGADYDRIKKVKYSTSSSSSNDFTWTYNRLNAQQACDTSGDDGSKYSTKVNDARGKNTAYCFRDALGTDETRVRVKDADGNTKTTSYSADMGITGVTTPSGEGVSNGSTSATYGGTGLTDQLSEVTEPRTANDGSADRAKTKFTYGHDASPVAGGAYLPGSIKRPNGSCSGYEYDSEGRTTAAYVGLVSPASQTAECDKPAKSGFHRKYYSNGTVAASWDANAWDANDTADEPNDNRKTIYTYWAGGDPGAAPNSSGQLKTIRKPGGSCDAPRKLCTSYTYDDRGRVTTVTDGRGKVTTYTYDAMDRTVGTFFNGATSCNATNTNCVTYVYDAEGNLKTRTDSAGISTFTYDLMNRQVAQEVPGSKVLLEYDGNGNLEKHTLDEATDQVTTYTYGDANQLTGVVNAGLGSENNTIEISSDKDGRVKQIHYPTSTQLRANFDFTQAGKPKSADVQTSSATLRDYKYDYVLSVLGVTVAVDQLQSKTVKIDSSPKKTEYAYEKERLKSSTVDGLPDYFYTHDDVGNVTSENSAGTTTYFGYDRAGQLCWRGQTDSSANRLNDTCQNGPSGSANFNQDAAGNNTNTTADPTSYNDDSQVATIAGVNMGYLDRGNDLRITAGATTYVNSPLGVVAKKTGANTTYFVRDPRGTILASYGAGGTLFYFSEYNGSVAALYNTNGVQVGSYTYSPYGKTDANGAAAQNNPFRYVGGMQDVDSTGNGSVYKLGARYYDAQGHFSQPDAIAGTISDPRTLSSYNYAGGDPINASDPSGYFLKEVAQAAGGALGLKDGSDFIGAIRNGDPAEAFAVATGVVVGTVATGVCSAALGTSGVGVAACLVGGEVAGNFASNAVRNYNYDRRDKTP